MSKLTDEQITGIWIEYEGRELSWRRLLARAIESAATEPLLQRIAELERQLEETRNQVLEEAANAVDAMKAPDGYGIQEQSLYDVATMEAADVVRALKGAKE